MSISLKPKDHFGAIYCYIHTPFYSFKNLILKSEIEFTDNEIIQYEVSPSNKDEVYLHYSKNGFQGNISLNSNLEPIEIDQAKIKYNSRTNLKKIKEIISVIFNRHSPFLWGYFLQVSIGFSFIELAQKYKFWIKESKNAISGCDKSCLYHNYQIALATIIHTNKHLLVLTVGLYFFLFHYKKIKDGNLASMVRWGALCVSIAGLLGTIDIYKNLNSPGTQQALLMTYAPENIKHINRSIASEIENLEEYKSAFGKEDKPLKANQENFNHL